MSGLEKYRGVKVTRYSNTKPLWKGPEVDGVTSSLLSRFIVCRERFRVHALEGLRPTEKFSAPLDFGNMWHTCEEAHAGGKDWEPALGNYYAKLLAKYKNAYQDEEIQRWFRYCRALFPVYIEHVATLPSPPRTPLVQEHAFDVQHELPSGRIVRLRGKYDSLDVEESPKGTLLVLQENKTKSQIDESKVERQLTFDLQTMIYLLTAKDRYWTSKKYGKNIKFAVGGVRYNVVKRSTHRQGKKETLAEFLTRLEGIVRDDPKEFFCRWDVPVSEKDIEEFRESCLDPFLEQLCLWYDVLTEKEDSIQLYNRGMLKNLIHSKTPYGVYNVLAEGGTGDLDYYLATGDTRGLTTAKTLFPELEMEDG